MEIRMLGPQDIGLLNSVEPGLFDNPVDPEQAAAFLASALHHIAIALDGDRIAAFASGTVLLHPDKPPSLFVNEVGTREECRRQGLARAVTRALIEHAQALGCSGAWLATEPDNGPALALYRAMQADEQGIVGFAWDGAFGHGER